MMKLGSLFSGIGGFDLGFARAGFRVVWQVEIEPYCREVLQQHFPEAKRYADIRHVGRHNLEPVDVICAGVPCQDVSVAGQRRGLAGARTGLFYEFARILEELRPAWFVFENVPGLLSSNSGRDFAEVLRVLMAECGYGVQWRCLDSQFFGVAQRRMRVFLVGSLGRPCPAEILFEREGGGGDSAPGEEARQDLAVTLTSGIGISGNPPGRRREDDFNLVVSSGERARALTGSMFKRHDEDTDTLVAATLRSADGHHGRSSPRGDGCDNLVAATLKQRGRGATDEVMDNLQVCATLNSGGNAGGFRSERGEHIVIQDVRGHREKRQHGIGIREGGSCYTLNATEQHAVAFNIIGCGQHGRNHAYATERTGALQHKGNAATGNEAGTLITSIHRADSFAGPHPRDAGGIGLRPDESGERGHDALTADPASAECTPPDADRMRGPAGIPDWLDYHERCNPEGQDSRRYRALGNAVTVSVARWIAERIREYG
ncbi:MAG TPA: DNA (cytosine-5-)-methyltransferase [Candidatus Binatia bacterium]